jgi:transglutaminase-like putative cysteine protease
MRPFPWEAGPAGILPGSSPSAAANWALPPVLSAATSTIRPTGDDHFQNVAEGSMHACAEVFLPGAGWKGFDSTNGMLANQYFIPCAVANEPKLTSPIQGSYYHSQMRIPSTMEVSLHLERVDSAPVNV